ncbi:MAG: 3-dehydroquinate synthase [Planctomycetota bacterium]|nr:MAG: 3-dehydroquinate synthase [Planctomycetota bacterium]
MSVRVDLDDRSYDIIIEEGIFESFHESSIFEKYSNIVVITDENVYGLYEKTINSGHYKKVIVLPAGETTKQIQYLEEIWNQLVELKLDRASLIIVIGGGVIGDIGGFAAASYMRGIDFVQVPTTLLAQVDSSVGGKVGINHPGGKNILGAFHQPQAVFIDLNVLKTLPEREFKSGLGEVVKYGVIWDKDFFEFMEDNAEEILSMDAGVISTIIGRCCEIKADIVKQDEFECGIRAVLNYGHTAGHGLENVFHYEKILHGEGVIFGMVVEGIMAMHRGLFSKEDFEIQNRLIEKLNLGFKVPAFNMSEYLDAITLDKKNTNNSINFILPTKIGEVVKIDGVQFKEIENATVKALDLNLFQ